MTTYTAITADQTAADAYTDVALMTALRDNVLAIQEGDATAPRIMFAALDDTAGQAIKPWELIESQTAATSSSVDFESLNTGTYKRFMLTARDLVPVTNGTNLWVRFGTSATSPITYQATTYSYILDYSDATDGSRVVLATGDAGSGIGTAIEIGGAITNNANRGYRGQIFLDNLDDASDITMIHSTGVSMISTVDCGFALAAGCWNSSAAVTAIRIMMSSGSISTGELSLYGMRQ